VLSLRGKNSETNSKQNQKKQEKNLQKSYNPQEQKCALAVDENAGEIGQTHREKEREKGSNWGASKKAQRREGKNGTVSGGTR
jgi:hypothetical protein